MVKRSPPYDLFNPRIPVKSLELPILHPAPMANNTRLEGHTSTNNFPDLCTVLVGPTKFPFSAHVYFLTKSSKSFKAACNRELTATSLIIDLPDTNPLLFELYVYWLHDEDDFGERLGGFSRKGVPEAPSTGLPGLEDVEANEVTTTIGLYMLGYAIEDMDFCCQAMVGLAQFMYIPISPADLAKLCCYVYQHLPSSCALCKALCFMVSKAEVAERNSVLPRLPEHIAQDVVTEMCRRIHWLEHDITGEEEDVVNLFPDPVEE